VHLLAKQDIEQGQDHLHVSQQLHFTLQHSQAFSKHPRDKIE